MFRYLSGVTKAMGLNDLYGFVDPQLTHEGNKFQDTQAYVTKCFQRVKEIILSYMLLGKSFLLTSEYNLSFSCITMNLFSSHP